MPNPVFKLTRSDLDVNLPIVRGRGCAAEVVGGAYCGGSSTSDLNRRKPVLVEVVVGHSVLAGDVPLQ